MNKIIVKTAIKTFLGIVIAVIIAFGAVSLALPSYMASMWEGFGNYSFATGYASLAYAYSGKSDDLARCFSDSILAENDFDIVKYGEKLVAHDGFSDLCEREDEENALKPSAEYSCGYRQFVYGNLCAAQYRRGDKVGAVATTEAAMQGVSDFPPANALIILSLEVIAAEDGATAAVLLTALDSFTPEGEVQTTAYNVLKTQLGIL